MYPTHPGPLPRCPLHCKSVYKAPQRCAGTGLASPCRPSSKGSFPFPGGRPLVQSWAALGIFCLVFPASAVTLLQVFLGSSSHIGWGQGGVEGLTCPHFIKFELDTKGLAVKSPPSPVLDSESSLFLLLSVSSAGSKIIWCWSRNVCVSFGHLVCDMLVTHP